ncbi:unnamed protein product, partial [Rotaria sp. Silwood2]
SLLVLAYLIKNGNEKVVKSAREHLYDLRSLENFSYHDEHGKDQGINIRHKVKELIEFIQDDDRIRDERKKAKANRDKYIDDRWNNNDELSNSTKTKDFVSEDYSLDKSNQNVKSISNKNQNKTQSSMNNKKPSLTNEEPVVNLLGEDIEFTAYVHASHDAEFGQFQEAISPTSPVQTTLWPTSTQSSSSMTFDPFASLETSPNHFQPNLFSTNQQQTFTNSSIFQQQSNINSMNNTWSSAAGKLDISLNNLIPHTRGDHQRTSLTLNQLTSPTSPTKSDFSILNTNTQSIFSTPNKK